MRVKLIKLEWQVKMGEKTIINQIRKDFFDDKTFNSIKEIESFVQLILTIGKNRIYENELPPLFLGAFDSEKIAYPL